MSHPSPTAAKPADPILIVAETDDPRIALASTSIAGIWIEIHDRLESAESVWRAFEDTADCTVFQRFDYLAAWQRNIGHLHGTQPLIAVIRGHGEEVLCLLPLALEKGTLRWLGQDNSDYCAPLLAPDFERRIEAGTFALLWSELCDALKRDGEFRFDRADLRKMPETIGTQRNPMLALPILPNPSNAHLMKMWGDWEAFYAEKRSSSTRRRDRTKLKRLGEFGEFQMISPESVADIKATFETLIEQKSAALSRMGAHNLFADPGVREFYLDLATGARTRPFVHVSKLQIGACQASTNLGFEHRGRYYYVFASYDAGEISRFGPGAAHLRELMQRAMARGLHEFDFTIGDERYKTEWADTELRLFDHVAAHGWRGLLPVLKERTELRLRRAIKQNQRLWAFVLKFRAWRARSPGSSTAQDADN